MDDLRFDRGTPGGGGAGLPESPNMNRMFPEGSKVELNGSVFEVAGATNSIVQLKFYGNDRRRNHTWR
jgi:hypothetical protein